ncbi:hypothetical protein AB0C18_34385 [Nonomuraea muscovyensis]|uniref:hypothetical protein n=1 Tax=Nonomuraea muscovyensis TaxID=1124761 RepID=UPI0033DC73C3
MGCPDTVRGAQDPGVGPGSRRQGPGDAAGAHTSSLEEQAQGPLLSDFAPYDVKVTLLTAYAHRRAGEPRFLVEVDAVAVV